MRCLALAVQEKSRLDVLLFQKGYTESREKAKALIMAGDVLVNDIKIDKPGTIVTCDSDIRMLTIKQPYVSRGGLKLKKAIDEFDIDFSKKTVIDIGASTGGFTDCSLQHGAELVYAVDVGYGQLVWKLRSDQRVVVFERTNIRYFKKDKLTKIPNIAVMDVSFISLKLVLSVVSEIIDCQGEIVALIKPQFEAGKEKIGKGGIVRDKDVHIDVLNSIMEFVKMNNLCIKGLTYSPIAGHDGNIEYLMYLRKKENNSDDNDIIFSIENIVKEAFFELSGK